DVDVAIRPARVVDVAGDVAAHAGVDHRAVGQLEAPDVAAANVAAFALEALLIRNLLSGVMNDPFVLMNCLSCVNTPPMNLRLATRDHRHKGNRCTSGI